MSSKSSKSLAKTTLSGISNLIKFLPTGTFFVFQFLNPVLTNNGQCQVANKYLSSILIVLCGLSCCFASFTDSYMDDEENIRYGIATNKGLWPNSSKKDLSSYKLRLGDFVHAFCSLIVFVVVALLDPNFVECFYPSFGSKQKELIMALPPIIGAVAGYISVVCPNERHGIGYPFSQKSTSTSSPN